MVLRHQNAGDNGLHLYIKLLGNITAKITAKDFCEVLKTIYKKLPDALRCDCAMI